jgi:predicted alpha/beta hydrolase
LDQVRLARWESPVLLRRRTAQLRYIIANSNHDYERSLKQMAKPVLAMSFESDNLAPPRSVDSFLGKLAASRVTTRHFSRNHPGLEKAQHSAAYLRVLQW